MSCENYLARVQEEDKEDLLPDFATKAQFEDLEGFYEIVNLRNIENGYTCDEQGFRSFGGTLVGADEPDFLRWSALIAAAVSAVNDTGRSPIELMSETMQAATEDAQKREVRTGVANGSASTDLGRYELTMEVIGGNLQFNISRNRDGKAR